MSPQAREVGRVSVCVQFARWPRERKVGGGVEGGGTLLLFFILRMSGGGEKAVAAVGGDARTLVGSQ